MRIVTHKNITLLENRILHVASNAAVVWGQAVASTASNTAPILSGDLRRSVVVAGPFFEGMTMRVLVGPDQTVRDYAERQEKDTSLGFGPLSLAAGAIRPWLRPAFDANRKLGLDLIKADIKAALKSI